MAVKIEITGNIGKVDRAQKVFKFSVCDSGSKKDHNGEWKSHPTWYNCLAFGETAKQLTELNLTKGMKIKVTGKYERNDWIDAAGKEHKDMQVKVFSGSDVVVLPRKEAGAGAPKSTQVVEELPW